MTQEELTAALAEVTLPDSHQEDLRILQEKVEKLEKEKRVSESKAQFLQMGYEGKLADKMAFALEDGDVKSVISTQKQYLEDFEKKLRAEILKGTPTPQPRKQADPDAEQFKNMTWTQKAELKRKNPDLFRQLNGGR